MEKKITIKEVAKAAGVSVATASRALNDPAYPVNAQLRQRVKQVAEQLEYVPNAVARALREKGYQDVGLVIPNVSNPFYLQAMLGIDEVLSKSNYSILLCNTMRDAGKERDCLRRLYERQAKGVILSSVENSSQHITEYMKKGMKFVLLDQMFSGVSCPGINFDSRAGARIAVEHLIAMGHRSIGFVTLPLTRWTRMEMYRGYQDALLAAGLPNDGALLFKCEATPGGHETDMELQAGKELALAFLAQGCPTTALLCVNDMVAIGLIQTLNHQGLKVPEDVSVIGFDDIPLAAAFYPALTTVHYPAIETGRLAALMLLESLSSSAASDLSMSMKLTPQLVHRDTVAPPKVATLPSQAPSGE